MVEGAHHSIGEVLSLLKEEHSDVTISKIRFLESQGLIEPERTPSGYRKFYDADIDRLRWILAQQRDSFLPLKVIKHRLEEAGFDLAEEQSADADPLPEPTLFTKRERDGTAVDTTVDLRDPDVADTLVDPEPAVPGPEHRDEDEPAAPLETVRVSPAVNDGDPLATPMGSVSMTAGELADTVRCDLGLVAELEKLGLIAAITTDEGDVFDHEALVVAKAAVELQTRGLQPRHLRMFKVAADREAGLYQQLVGPLLKKGGDSQARARSELNEMVRLGEAIHRSILRRGFDVSHDEG